MSGPNQCDVNKVKSKHGSFKYMKKKKEDKKFQKRETKQKEISCKCNKSSKVRVVQESDSSNDYDKEVHAEMLFDKKPVKFQLDCGASVKLLPIKYIGNREIIPCDRTLVMWNGTKVKPAGTCHINIRSSKTGKEYSVEFVIVNEDLTPLLGLQANEKMNLLSIHRDNFKAVHNVRFTSKDKLGNLAGKIHLHVNPEAIPVTLPCSSVPICVRGKLKNELDRLVELEALGPVDQPTEWTSQFVTTMKKFVDVKICVPNEALRRERYQLPVLDEIFPELSKARIFSNVDLSSASWHLPLDEESSLLTAFIAPFGRYKWLRLPLGLNVSSEIFQKRLSQALEGLPGVLCIADNIIIHGKDDQEHDENLQRFLAGCCEKGIKLKKEKLESRSSQIAFHGHILTSEGLKIDPDKVRAIQEMPRPHNPKDVQRLNGMVTT